MLRPLPGATRAAIAAFPAVSRRRLPPPAASRRLLSPRDVPPLPDLRVQVSADAVVVVQLVMVVRAIAQATAASGITVTAAATARADGGSKAVDATHTVGVTAAADARARYARTAAADATVSASAVALPAARADHSFATTPTASIRATANLPAIQSVTVTARADIVAVGGTVPVDAVHTATVTAAATARPRIAVSSAAALTVTAEAARVIRMAVAAVETVTVAAAVALRIPVTATVSISVTATADAKQAYAPQKMVKSGVHNLTSVFAHQDVLGWVPGYSGTVVVDNTGLAVKAGIPITVSATVLRAGTNASNQQRIVNTAGTVIAASTSATPASIGPVTFTPPADTVLRVQAYAASGLSGNQTIPDDPATHLTVTPI